MENPGRLKNFASMSAPPSEKILNGAARQISRIFFALFLVSFVLVWLKTSFLFLVPEKSNWPEAVLVLAAAATTLATLARQLPVQNVFLAAGIIAAISGTAQAISALSGVPFGPYLYTGAAGPKFFNVLPWSVPVIWVIVLFNARGVARLILRPWRKSRLYGFRLIAVTAALSLAFDFGLEPFATRVREYWLWQPTKLRFLWQSTPPSNFLGWIVVALIVLAFATPPLINKSHQKFPPDYHPLIVWILLSVLFASGALKQQLWIAALFIGATTVVTVFMAIRGARW